MIEMVDGEIRAEITDGRFENHVLEVVFSSDNPNHIETILIDGVPAYEKGCAITNMNITFYVDSPPEITIDVTDVSNRV